MLVMDKVETLVVLEAKDKAMLVMDKAAIQAEQAAVHSIKDKIVQHLMTQVLSVLQLV